MNNLLRIFQPFARVKHTLPILDFVKIENGTAHISDLHTWVQFPIDKPDGYYDLRMNELFFIQELDDDYPVLPDLIPISSSVIPSTFDLLKYASCTANDDLRPVMNSIYINTAIIAASDAHVLRYNTDYISNADPGFEALIPKSQPLLARCRVADEPLTLVRTESNVMILFSDCKIIVRNTEGVYPKVLSVVPNWDEKELRCFTLPVSTIQEMDKTIKSFSCFYVRIAEAVMEVENIDLCLVKTWPPPAFCERPNRCPDALLMPVDITNSEHTGNIVGINPSQLVKLTTLFKGNVILGMFDPSRALAIWLEPAAGRGKPVCLSKTNTKISLPSFGGVGGGLTIIQYSPKAIALFGDTKPIKDTLRNLGGHFNPGLRNNSRRMAGWIFPIKRESAVRQLIAS